MLIDQPGEQDVTNGGWDPNYWVNEGIKLHVQYLVLAFVPQLDSAAYSAYKGRAVNLHTRPGFGQLTYDYFVEVMNRTRTWPGSGSTTTTSSWEQNGLYERIRVQRPEMTLSGAAGTCTAASSRATGTTAHTGSPRSATPTRTCTTSTC